MHAQALPASQNDALVVACSVSRTLPRRHSVVSIQEYVPAQTQLCSKKVLQVQLHVLEQPACHSVQGPGREPWKEQRKQPC